MCLYVCVRVKPTVSLILPSSPPPPPLPSLPAKDSAPAIYLVAETVFPTTTTTTTSHDPREAQARKEGTYLDVSSRPPARDKGTYLDVAARPPAGNSTYLDVAARRPNGTGDGESFTGWV